MLSGVDFWTDPNQDGPTVTFLIPPNNIEEVKSTLVNLEIKYKVKYFSIFSDSYFCFDQY